MENTMNEMTKMQYRASTEEPYTLPLIFPHKSNPMSPNAPFSSPRLPDSNTTLCASFPELVSFSLNTEGWIQLWDIVRTTVNVTMYLQYNNNKNKLKTSKQKS
jgi:hypothetical protein